MRLWLLIALMALVTYASKAAYLLVPVHRIPKSVQENLDLIPVVILSAIVANSLLVHRGALDLPASLTYLAASAITVAVYFASKKPGLAVTVGLLSHVLMRALL